MRITIRIPDTPIFAYLYLSKYWLGTPRYNAPEVLGKTIDTRKFDSFIQADIYSASLIIWEIINRTSDNINVYDPPPPSLPYDDILEHATVTKTNEEKIMELKPIVVDRNCRPKFTNYAGKLKSKLRSLLARPDEGPKLVIRYITYTRSYQKVVIWSVF